MLRKIFLAVNVLLAIALIGVTGYTYCPAGTNQVYWDTFPDEVTADAQDHFDLSTESPPYLVFSWNFEEIPFIVGIEMDEDGSRDVTDVQYTPDVVFPVSCLDEVNVEVEGNLNPSAADGLLKTRGVAQNGEAQDEAFHFLDVYEN